MRALQFILLCGAAPLAGAQNDSCPVTTTPVSNYGVNSGGCFKCHTAGSESTWATGEELEALCKRTCLADAKCMAYETSRPDMVPIFEGFSLISPETINCCIEHVRSALSRLLRVKCLTPDRSRAHRQPRGNLDAITTVPMGKLHKNTNQDKASFLSTKQKEKELALEKAQVAESSLMELNPRG